MFEKSGFNSLDATVSAKYCLDLWQGCLHAIYVVCGQPALEVLEPEGLEALGPEAAPCGLALEPGDVGGWRAEVLLLLPLLLLLLPASSHEQQWLELSKPRISIRNHRKNTRLGTRLELLFLSSKKVQNRKKQKKKRLHEFGEKIKQIWNIW